MSELQLRSIILPVNDMTRGLEFYTSVLGLQEKFRDGDRYAALAGESMSLALASGEESAGGMPALAVRCEAVEAAVDGLVRAGCRVVSAPRAGGHEVRATVADPEGNMLVVYGPR